MSSLRNKIVSASKWSLLSEIASRALSPLIFVALARLLTPEDYGVAAIATIVISFSQVFWEAGLGKALIQRKTQIDDAYNTVFWSNIVLGLCIYFCILLFSGQIAALFHDSRVEDVLKIQSLQILVAAGYSVPVAIFQRNLDFKSLFWVRLVTTVIPGIAALPLALYGFSYWALVIGALAGSVAQCIVLWIICPWHPLPRYNWEIAKSLFHFGKWVMGESLLGWFYIWADSMVIGYFLSTSELGLYRTGNIFIGTAYMIVFNPIISVLFSALSRLQGMHAQFMRMFMDSTKIIVGIALPMAATFFCIPAMFGQIIFGDTWRGIDQVIMIMGLAQGLSWIISANTEAYRAVGRADVSSKIMGFGFLYYMPLYIISSNYGLSAFLWTRLFLVCITVPIYFVVTRKIFNINLLFSIFEVKYLVVGAMFMGVFMYFMNRYLMLESALLRYAIISIVGLLTYSVFLLPYRQHIANMIKSILQKQQIVPSATSEA